MLLRERNRGIWYWISALSPSSVACYLLILKDKISEPLDLLFWFMTRSYNATVPIGHYEACGQSTKDPFWPTGSALEHTGSALEHQLLG